MRLHQSVAAVLTLTAALSVAQSTTPQLGSYFPSAKRADKTHLDDFAVGWYSNQLAALKEPNLWKPSPAIAHDSYRFLWLRTFHHPIAVRLDIASNGEGTLTTKVADGAGGYNPGKLSTDNTVTVEKNQVAQFLSRVNGDDFWTLPTKDPKESGEDGSEWIIEGTSNGKYHVVSRWTPSSGPIFDLGKFLAIDMAKIDIPKNEFY